MSLTVQGNNTWHQSLTGTALLRALAGLAMTELKAAVRQSD